MADIVRPGMVVGAGPLIRAMAARIGLVPTMDGLVGWDATRCRLSPGERILALLVNLLTDREPLYQVAAAFRLADVPLLLGAGITAADLTDDALGRALDKLAAAGGRRSSVRWPRGRMPEGIDRGGLHLDTTSRSLSGAYAAADGTRGVTPRHGHAQDPRDDLKPILFTGFVNRDGVPRMGTVEDGNRSDKRLNRDPRDRIVRAFSPEALRDLVYIADSALVTGPHLDALAAAAITWLSRRPDTFGVATTAKAAAWAADAWIPVGRVAASPRGALYTASEQTGTMGERPYRLGVYRSSSLDRRKAKTLERALAQARTVAERAVDTLTAPDCACAADAEAAATAFRATAPRWWPCRTTVGRITVTDTRPHRGRPRRDVPAPAHTVYRVRVTWGPRDEAAVQTELARRSTRSCSSRRFRRRAMTPPPCCGNTRAKPAWKWHYRKHDSLPWSGPPRSEGRARYVAATGAASSPGPGRSDEQCLRNDVQPSHGVRTIVS